MYVLISSSRLEEVVRCLPHTPKKNTYKTNSSSLKCLASPNCRPRLLLLMVPKSGGHQWRLVVSPIIYRVQDFWTIKQYVSFRQWIWWVYWHFPKSFTAFFVPSIPAVTKPPGRRWRSRRDQGWLWAWYGVAWRVWRWMELDQGRVPLVDWRVC